MMNMLNGLRRLVGLPEIYTPANRPLGSQILADYEAKTPDKDYYDRPPLNERGCTAVERKNMLQAADVARRPVEKPRWVTGLSMAVLVFDAYDAGGRPRNVLGVQPKSPDFFTAVGHRALGRYRATRRPAYYDIAVRAHDKAQAMRAGRQAQPTETV